LNDVPVGQDDSLNMYGVVARSAVLDYLGIMSAGAFGSVGDTDVGESSFGVQPYYPLDNDKLKILGDFQVLWGKEDGLFFSDDDFGYSLGGGTEYDLADVLSVVAYYRRSLPRFNEIRGILDCGEIGTVRHVSWSLSKPANSIDRSGTRNWRTEREIAPGGYFDDLASHGLDFFAYLTWRL